MYNLLAPKVAESPGATDTGHPTTSLTQGGWALSSELVTPHLTWDDSLLDAYLEARRHVQEAVLAAAPSQKVTSFSVEEGRIAFGDREFACVCAAGSSKEGNVVLLRFPTAVSVPNELAWLSAAEPRWRKLSVSRPTLRLMGQHGVAVTRAMANVLVATIGAVCFGSRFRGIFRLGYRGAVAYLILVDSGE